MALIVQHFYSPTNTTMLRQGNKETMVTNIAYSHVMVRNDAYGHGLQATNPQAETEDHTYEEVEL